MLPKSNRLKKNRDIERVFKKGRGYKENFLFLKLAENDPGPSRFAFIVSQKVAKKAVARNKIKKRLREAVKIGLPQLKSGFDVVIVAQKGIETENFQEIKKSAEKLFKKAKLISRPT